MPLERGGTTRGLGDQVVISRDGAFVTNNLTLGDQTRDRTLPVYIEMYYPWMLYYLNGSMDEVRIMDTVLTPDWIATEYTNQYAPQNFILNAGEQRLPEGTIITIY